MLIAVMSDRPALDGQVPDRFESSTVLLFIETDGGRLVRSESGGAPAEYAKQIAESFCEAVVCSGHIGKDCFDPIANAGVMRVPHFAVQVADRQLDFSGEQRACSELVAERVADMMVTVVTDGTATSAAVEGFEVAAKTGTGEIASDKGGYLKDRYLASLIGFAPARNPQVLVYVGLNETPYLSYSSAGPVFSAIMGEALSDLGVLAQE